MDENDTDDIISGGVELGAAAKERLKSNPDSVRALLTGTVQIEEAVTVYPNKALNLRFAQAQERLIEMGNRVARKEGESDEDYLARVGDVRKEYEDFEGELEALKQELLGSAVTFNLVSVPKKAIKNLKTAARKKFPADETADWAIQLELDEQRQEYFECSIVAAHLVADGYSIEDIINIRDNWPNRAWAQLWTVAQKLSIADDYLTGTIDADF